VVTHNESHYTVLDFMLQKLKLLSFSSSPAVANLDSAAFQVNC